MANSAKINVYNLFNITKNNYTWDQLKSEYKRLALIHHPDKPTGNKEFFHFVTENFKKLAKELQLRQAQKSHYELKKEYEHENKRTKSHMHSTPPMMTGNDRSEETFINKFNRLFEENKLPDDNDIGYADQMVPSSSVREDIDIKKMFKEEKVSNKTFNNVFEKHVTPSKAIVKFKEPEPIYYGLRGLSFSVLGENVNDFSSTGVSGKNTNIEYTDYMRAFKEERPPQATMRKQFKNEKEYQQYSDTYMKVPLTEKEHRRIAKKEHKDKKLEEVRLQNIIDRDQVIEQQYQRLQNLLR